MNAKMWILQGQERHFFSSKSLNSRKSEISSKSGIPDKSSLTLVHFLCEGFNIVDPKAGLHRTGKAACKQMYSFIRITRQRHYQDNLFILLILKQCTI